VTFGGRSEVTVAPGADIWSDSVDLDVPALSSITISLHIPNGPDRATGHGDARATSYLAAGDQSASQGLRDAKPIGHWYYLSAVAISGGTASGTVVALGDSITDSYMSTVDGNGRWPDVLARHLHAQGSSLAVVDQGLGGNRVLTDIIGTRLLDRLDRDVFSVPGVRCIILLEGVNDLGSLTRKGPLPQGEHDKLVARLIEAYRSIVAQAHARGVRVIGGTIMPYLGSDYYHPDHVNEADRHAVNAWIRGAGHLDGFVDFDAATRDPDRPGYLLPRYDSGDHIHPSPAGYVAMAEAIPLKLIRRRCGERAR
jgi:lysophospholipase L1-like esterase